MFRQPSPVVSLEQRAPEVIDRHSHYWRGIFVNLAANAFVVGSAVGGAWVFTSGFVAQHVAMMLPPFSFELPADSAMAAFGVLATLIVALQVGVRVPFADEVAPAAAARQLGLETLARLCGSSALAVGLAATLAQPAPWTTSDPLRYIGPAAGALLLAVFAGDAASASSARLSQAIFDVRQASLIERLITARNAIDASSSALSWKGYALQLAIGLVAIPVVVACVFLALWGLDSWPVLPSLVLGTSCSIVLGSVLLVVTLALWARRAVVESAYARTAAALCGGSVVALSFVLQPGPLPSDFRDVFWRSSVAAAVTLIWALTCVSLACRVPFTTLRGLGSACLARAFQFDIERYERAPRPVGRRTVGLVLLSIVFPPAGIVVALRERAAGSRSAAAFWVASSVLFAWVAAISVLLALNPSFA
jgi:hypothetical protein